MNWTLKLISFLVFSVMLSACQDSNNTEKPSTVAIQILFNEQEMGVEPYITRMILTDNFLRIDEGNNSRDFILFDRKKKIINSISFDEERILQIKNRPITLKKPENLNWVHTEIPDTSAPSIYNIHPTTHRFSVNNTPCYEVIAAKGLLDNLTKALLEYKNVLAGEQASTINNTPKEFRNNCDTARLVFHVADLLKYGLPVAEWDQNGYRRVFRKYEELKDPNPELFQLPEKLTVFSLDEMKPITGM
jgi:hypothetical protein